jgi:hypothetical protein
VLNIWEGLLLRAYTAGLLTLKLFYDSQIGRGPQVICGQMLGSAPISQQSQQASSHCIKVRRGLFWKLFNWDKYPRVAQSSMPADFLLVFFNSLPHRKDEGYYSYPLRVGEILCLLINGVRYLLNKQVFK